MVVVQLLLKVKHTNDKEHWKSKITSQHRLRVKIGLYISCQIRPHTLQSHKVLVWNQGQI